MLPHYHYNHQVKQDTYQDIDAASSKHYSPEGANHNTDPTLDKIKWQSWQEEVRNLLIFASLLSAIVTPFIIESNKKLRPNSKEAVVNLFIHLAAGQDNTSRVPIPSIPTFSPNPSYIRANTFWFITLILSLTTILTGSLLLQWLRAYQSYTLPSFSGQGPLSPILNFTSRLDRPEKRYPYLVLATLPLFLQLAVVLFLGGLMDFVQIFGDCGALVSVGVVIAFAWYIYRVFAIQYGCI